MSSLKDARLGEGLLAVLDGRDIPETGDSSSAYRLVEEETDVERIEYACSCCPSADSIFCLPVSFLSPDTGRRC